MVFGLTADKEHKKLNELEEKRSQAKEAAKTNIAAIINMGWIGALGKLPGGDKSRQVPQHIQDMKIAKAEAKRERRKLRNLKLRETMG